MVRTRSVRRKGHVRLPYTRCRGSARRLACRLQADSDLKGTVPPHGNTDGTIGSFTPIPAKVLPMIRERVTQTRPAQPRASGPGRRQHTCAHILLEWDAADTVDSTLKNGEPKVRVGVLFARAVVERHHIPVADDRFSGRRSGYVKWPCPFRRTAERHDAPARRLTRRARNNLQRWANAPPDTWGHGHNAL